jgi:hypothetical protein
MIRGDAPPRAPAKGPVVNEGSTQTRPEEPASGPRTRTSDLIADELRSVHHQLDRHLANGDLALAGECCFDLEQLRIELAALNR